MNARKWIAVLASLLVASIAFAGYVQPFPVSIQVNADGSGSAEGDLVSARFDDSDQVSIGCGTRTLAGYIWGFCQAGDSSGQSVFCTFTDPNLLAQARALSDYSYLGFAWDASGICTVVGVSTQSFYIPSDKDEKK